MTIKENPMSNQYMGTWRVLRWSNRIRTISTSLCKAFSLSERIIWASFSLAPSMGNSFIVSSPTRRQHVWKFPGKGKLKWTPYVDEGGRSSKTDNSRGESILTKGMTQGSRRKKRDEQREATVATEGVPYHE